MRRLSLIFLALSAIAIHAQEPAYEPTEAPDGNITEFIQSVAVPNAPFRAVVRTHWTHTLPDGTKSTIYNHRLVARDSAGRVFQERRSFDPHGDTQDTPVTQLQYDDPARHERTLCFPERRVCRTSTLLMPTTVPTPSPSGPLPNGRGTLTRLDLGHRTLFDLDTVGTRETTTLNAGAFGNEAPQSVVRELWFSPRLQLNILTARSDPRSSSTQTIAVTDLTLGEPDPHLFDPPSTFRVLTPNPAR